MTPLFPQANTVYFELFGNGLLYSVNYDRMITDNISVRAGYGGLSVSSASTMEDVKITMMPVLGNYLMGGGNHKLEIGAGRMTGIKMIKPKACSRHFIEHRCLEVWMAVVTGLRPAVVIAHQQDDIRFVGCCHRESIQADPGKEKAHDNIKSQSRTRICN